MKTVTVEQFRKFGPCWLETAEGRGKFARIAAIKNEWTALDVLNLSDVSVQDKFWSVLREEFIDAPILHEFACRCAEYALSFVESPDPRSIAAIEAKRKWLRGEITDAELDVARGEARDAAHDAAMYAARIAARVAAQDVAWVIARVIAQDAAWVIAQDAAWAAARNVIWSAANDAALDTACAAWVAASRAARDAAQEHELEILRELLEEGDEQ